MKFRLCKQTEDGILWLHSLHIATYQAVNWTSSNADPLEFQLEPDALRVASLIKQEDENATYCLATWNEVTKRWYFQDLIDLGI